MQATTRERCEHYSDEPDRYACISCSRRIAIVSVRLGSTIIPMWAHWIHCWLDTVLCPFQSSHMNKNTRISLVKSPSMNKDSMQFKSSTVQAQWERIWRNLIQQFPSGMRGTVSIFSETSHNGQREFTNYRRHPFLSHLHTIKQSTRVTLRNTSQHVSIHNHL
ncbi:hypothetical protein EV401DRAFT_530499 [Pisolithus croceorrhizus]|nr:hypothetical protein EV401DRAFT_530499 [Pisolithus croceorrhizus]